jgi:hypothetical protein
MALNEILMASRTNNGARMHTKEIGENLFLIDLETGVFKNLNFELAFKTVLYLASPFCVRVK